MRGLSYVQSLSCNLSRIESFAWPPGVVYHAAGAHRPPAKPASGLLVAGGIVIVAFHLPITLLLRAKPTPAPCFYR